VTGDLLDLDFDVVAQPDALQVQADKVRIHKVNGKARYTYDEEDNMVPVTD
jgi:hypothetical protein